MPTLLQAQNLSFAFGDRPALREVSLRLEGGEVLALIGPNGSGKTTLIRCLLGQLPAVGSIHWLEKPLSIWRRRDLARLVAYLPQTPVVDDSQSVLDVLRLGRSPYWGAFGLESGNDQQVVAQVAAASGLTDLLNRNMGELSGGQRQRVLLSRCLAQQPQALLLDEPSTFLDLKHQFDLCRSLRDLSRSQGIGVLMASHDLNLAGAFADRMVLLRDGAVAASGSPREVLRPEILSSVYGVPIERMDRGESPIVFPAI